MSIEAVLLLACSPVRFRWGLLGDISSNNKVWYREFRTYSLTQDKVEVAGIFNDDRIASLFSIYGNKDYGAADSHICTQQTFVTIFFLHLQVGLANLAKIESWSPGGQILVVSS